jgi:hypothetical protein
MARRKEMTVREEDTTKARTIYMALDLGRRCWTVGVLRPGIATPGFIRSPAATGRHFAS